MNKLQLLATIGNGFLSGIALSLLCLFIALVIYLTWRDGIKPLFFNNDKQK